MIRGITAEDETTVLAALDALSVGRIVAGGSELEESLARSPIASTRVEDAYIELLNSHRPSIRVFAVNQLTGSRRALPCVARALLDPDAEVRSAAVRSFGRTTQEPFGTSLVMGGQVVRAYGGVRGWIEAAEWWHGSTGSGSCQ